MHILIRIVLSCPIVSSHSQIIVHTFLSNKFNTPQGILQKQHYLDSCAAEIKLVMREYGS